MKRFLSAGVLAGLAAAAILGATTSGASAHQPKRATKHVLLISVDGLHQTDLAWFIRHHPHSALARLTRKGVEFTHAQTPFPSDSFPGMVGQVTGGNPQDDRRLLRRLLEPRPAAGRARRTAPASTPGAEVTYFEQADLDPLALDAGQGLPGLPGRRSCR